MSPAAIRLRELLPPDSRVLKRSLRRLAAEQRIIAARTGAVVERAGGHASPSTVLVIASWALIAVGVGAIVVPRFLGRDSVDFFGMTLTAEAPRAQPVTWAGVAVAIVGVALLVTRGRTGFSSKNQ